MNRLFHGALVLATLIVFIAIHSSSGVSAQKAVDFSRDVRPILSDNCFQCHGPDDTKRMARLRLDTREGAFAKQGLIVPGDPTASRLFKRVSSTDPESVMPPPSTGHRLTVGQIETLRLWIQEGALWNEHWAFVAPKKAPLPEVALKGWVRNPIDNFVLARLEREGLKPSPEADKVTLIRRLTLDLTGLPPSTREVDEFLADTAPDSYEKVVDRLLASPHYGERMALYWLDIARYADTHGYHIDSHRDMWPWRDWVIRAFNANKPYDQFITEQLAGDLLPNATTDQKIATGFNRNHMINFEGGAIPEEYLNEYLVDRVETTSNAFMALTMGCARCHSHKYDPLSQKEFYQFYAFFNAVPEIGLDGQTGNAKPFLQLPDAGQKERQDSLAANIKKLEKAEPSVIGPDQSTWEKTLSGRIAVSPREGLVAHYELDGSLTDVSGHYLHGRRIQGSPEFGGGKIGRAVSFDGDSEVRFGALGPNEKTDPFTIAMWLRTNVNLPITLFQKCSDPQTRRGIEAFFDSPELIGVQRRASHLNVRLMSQWPSNAIHVRSKDLVRIVDWAHVAIAYDGSGKASGISLYVDGVKVELEALSDNLTGSITTSSEFEIGDKAFGRPYRGQIDDLRFYNRALSAPELHSLAVDYPVQVYLSGVLGGRSKDENEAIRSYFLTYRASPELQSKYLDLTRLKKEKGELEKRILTTMVMSDMEKPRDSYLLARGDYRNKTEKVSAGVPSVLPPLPAGLPPNRLALAGWLCSPNHPLTSRVAVNRVWQLFFGLGLVKTSEDFGAQGELPSNPELLDWLAVDFRQGEATTPWNMKALIRTIVTSSTYRQSSAATPQQRERDPENRLLARGPRFRLQAELIRDSALAVSGLLNNDIGGKSVFPYQPPGLWEELAFGDGFSVQTYVQSKGRDLYRRSMYTFWKRTVPPAALNTFDAPDREKCVARRAVTNTPLQALILMNDPTYLEASRVLAARSMESGPSDINGRIAFIFRAVTARTPSAAEISVLRELFNQRLLSYRRDPKAVTGLLTNGESMIPPALDKPGLAAMTMVASTILNLDEAVTKE